MAKNNKTAIKSSPGSKGDNTNQGIYGLNIKQLRIKKSRTYIHGSDLTGTVK
jgi:hypothetical protein